MKTIWNHKFNFKPDVVKFGMPKGAEILAVNMMEYDAAGMQMRTPKLIMWFTADTDAEPEPRYFRLIVSGEQLPDDLIKYHGTGVLREFVAHLIEVEKPEE